MSTSVAFLKLSDLYCFRSLLFSLNPFRPSLKYFESYKSVLDPFMPLHYLFPKFYVFCLFYAYFYSSTLLIIFKPISTFYHRWPFYTFQRLFTPFSKNVQSIFEHFSCTFKFFNPFSKADGLLLILFWPCLTPFLPIKTP